MPDATDAPPVILFTCVEGLWRHEGLNLPRGAPNACKMVLGIIVVAAISISNVDLAAKLAPMRRDRE